MRQTCLMLGAGHTKPERRYKTLESAPEEETEWVRLDINPQTKPDALFNLDWIEKPWWLGGWWLPFRANKFDEIHGYSVIEHYGRQGDWRGFFRGMKELWRVLKHGGVFIGGCPSYDDKWAFGDPGHTRIVTDGTLSYLTKEFYDINLAKTPATDYRSFVEPCWWELLHAADEDLPAGGRAFYWCLRKV